MTPDASAEPTEAPHTASVSPTASTATTTPRSPSALGLTVSADDIGAQLDVLMQIAQQNNGIRAAGTPGYVYSANYVERQLTQLGFQVYRWSFNFIFFDEAEPVQLIVGDQQWSGADWLHAMLYSAGGSVAGALQSVRLTPDGRVMGTGGCDPADWSDFVAGHVALVASGPCYRRDQVVNAQDAGAIGLISLYPNWEVGQTRRPTLLDPAGITIPAIVAGGEPTQALLSAVAAGGSAQIVANVTMTPATNDNVLAEWPGQSEQVVMLGAHLDSVLDGPGINDNGSGVATLLSLARSVAANPQPQKGIRFGFWGAEEYGELGSTAYVQGQDSTALGKIEDYFNLDMVGSPNAGRFVYDDTGAPAGSDELVQRLLKALSAAGKPGLTTDVGGASDHFQFGQAGIPVAGVFSGLGPLTSEDVSVFGGEVGVPADACYHLACDTRDNINLDSAVTLGQAVADVVQELAY